MYKARRVVEVLFLCVFILTIILGKLPLWMGILGLSFILTLIWGRIFCGWFCPVLTCTQIVERYSPLKGNKVPHILLAGYWRWIMLVVFVAGLLWGIIQGQQLPLFVVLVFLGILVVFFLNSPAFHRYICPVGALFSLPARFSRWGFVVNDKCINCLKCQEVCPSNAVHQDNEKVRVENEECLLCLECQHVCPTKAIEYGALK